MALLFMGVNLYSLHSNSTKPSGHGNLKKVVVSPGAIAKSPPKIQKPQSPPEPAGRKKDDPYGWSNHGPRHPNREPQMQVVFSTSCSYAHDWQSYLFFVHAMLHKQPGNVTRIVSGCDEKQEVELRKMHNEQIKIMSDRFNIHFTPEFGKIEGRSWETTKYWNKPFGVKHWLENNFGYKMEGDITTEVDDDIVVLVDPDMLMQRPFLNEFSGFPKTIWHKSIQDSDKLYFKVQHGRPIAQTYSFGDKWLKAATKGNFADIVGADSPAIGVSQYDADVTFSAGPPYMLTARDMFILSYHWAKFLPGINDHFEGMMAEMYGYCTAAAHLDLRHQIAKGFMVSNVDMTDGEGWEFLDGISDEACDVSTYNKNVPHVLHFCQRYGIGEYFISKYKVPTSVLTCEHALVEEPPLDIAATTAYSHYADGSYKNYTTPQQIPKIYRNAFMVCSILPALNKAAEFYKQHHCPNGANYNKTWNHFRAQAEQGCIHTDKGCPQ